MKLGNYCISCSNSTNPTSSAQPVEEKIWYLALYYSLILHFLCWLPGSPPSHSFFTDTEIQKQFVSFNSSATAECRFQLLWLCNTSMCQTGTLRRTVGRNGHRPFQAPSSALCWWVTRVGLVSKEAKFCFTFSTDSFVLPPCSSCPLAAACGGTDALYATGWWISGLAFIDSSMHYSDTSSSSPGITVGRVLSLS